MVDDNTFPAQQMYWLQWVTNFNKILDSARVGTLRPEWRDGLTQAFPLSTLASTELKDSSITAVLDIITGERRPWEPGATSRGWQDALESWHYDSMLVANSVLDQAYRVALLRADEARKARKNHYLLYIAAGVQPPEPREFSETDHWDRILGAEMYRWELLRRYQVAVANAEYRAGLAAGGVELREDWLNRPEFDAHLLSREGCSHHAEEVRRGVQGPGGAVGR
jgi:hypothetical protein